MPYLAAMGRYLALSRTHTHSLVFALPLLLLYEAGAVAIAVGPSPDVRNGADVILRSLLIAGGMTGTAALTGLLIAVGTLLVLAERRRRAVQLRAGILLGMLAESALYALLFGAAVASATRWVLQPLLQAGMTALSTREQMVLSLGAGLYEELVFRVLLAGGLDAAFRTVGAGRLGAGAAAALLSAVVFSAFHYIGPYGDPWVLESFTFRLLAGLAFSALFLLRGFGITAWTHALYDVFLTLAMRA